MATKKIATTARPIRTDADEEEDVLSRVSRIGNQARFDPTEDLAIPSPYTDSNDRMVRDQILSQFDNEEPTSSTMPVGKPIADDSTLSDSDESGIPEGAVEEPDTSPNLDWRKSLKYAGGAMPGFNTGDYGGDEKAANTVKNTFGRIASRYPAKPSSLKLIAADPDFQRAFPGARFDEKDRLWLAPGTLSDFESGVDVGHSQGIDVLGASDPGSDTAAGWSWQDLGNDEGGGAGMGAMMGGGSPTGIDELGALADSDQLEEILAAIDQLAQGKDPYLTKAIDKEFKGVT